jgi:methylated-DNA-[protein]-cysteine S-methyltransferase
MWVAQSDQGLVMVEWEMPQPEMFRIVEQRLHRPVVLDARRTSQAVQQLQSYLEGHLREFSLLLDFSSQTPFQQRVLRLTAQIPYGKTATYKDLALLSGHPNASRAVGRVEATNPIPIIIPCHRVVGTDGSLHGYGGPGGIKLKAWLLQLEQPPD